MSKKPAAAKSAKGSAPSSSGAAGAGSGGTVKDVPAGEFIAALAAHFKKSAKMEVPDWADIVKTGIHKELCPQDPDWYFVRAASIARRIYLRGGIGVGEFARIYGGLNGNGSGRRHFTPAARGLIRRIMSQLCELDLLGKKKDKKGRFLTRNGQRELDTIAGQLLAARKA